MQHLRAKLFRIFPVQYSQFGVHTPFYVLYLIFFPSCFCLYVIGTCLCLSVISVAQTLATTDVLSTSTRRPYMWNTSYLWRVGNSNSVGPWSTYLTLEISIKMATGDFIWWPCTILTTTLKTSIEVLLISFISFYVMTKTFDA